MLGFLLGTLSLIVGLYLLISCLWRKLRCRTFVSATVVLGYHQDTLTDKGTHRKNKFPQYRFTLNEKSYLVTDYNVPHGAVIHAGDVVHLFCDPSRPDRCWYPNGGLWRDVIWGVLSLLFAGFILFLFLI